MGARPRPARRPKIGIALGSGVARGWAHLGILRGLKRHGIEPDMVAGTSIGALVGGAHLAGYADVLEAWARSLTKVRLVTYLDFYASTGGLIGGRRLVERMKQYLGDLRIEDLPAPFIAVATDLASGHEVWLREGLLVDALRASFSLPGLFQPVTGPDGRWLVDGALVNPVPVSACRAMGAQITIAVNLNSEVMRRLTQPDAAIPSAAGIDGLREAADGRSKGTGWFRDGRARRKSRHEPDYPSVFSVMVSALNIFQDRIARSRLAGEPPDVLIAPRLSEFGLFEFDRAGEIAAEGEAAVERAIPDLRAALDVFGAKLGDEVGPA